MMAMMTTMMTRRQSREEKSWERFRFQSRVEILLSIFLLLLRDDICHLSGELVKLAVLCVCQLLSRRLVPTTNASTPTKERMRERERVLCVNYYLMLDGMIYTEVRRSEEKVSLNASFLLLKNVTFLFIPFWFSLWLLLCHLSLSQRDKEKETTHLFSVCRFLSQQNNNDNSRFSTEITPSTDVFSSQVSSDHSWPGEKGTKEIDSLFFFFW